MKINCLITAIFFLSINSEIAKGQTHIVKISTQDSVIIDDGEDFKIAKSDIPALLKKYPEFKFSHYVSPPEDDDCEACEDNYFRLYAYFLKQHDGGKKYEIERQKIDKNIQGSERYL